MTKFQDKLKQIATDFGGQWKWAPGWDGEYAVSSDGRIASCGKKNWTGIRLLKLTPSPDYGYIHVTLFSGGKREGWMVHKLVLTTFVGPQPDGHQCDHINNNRSDNRVENLQWVTPFQNLQFRQERGSIARGERAGQSKFSENQVRAIKKLLAIGVQANIIAVIAGCPDATISAIKRGITWAHLAEEHEHA